MRWASLVGLAVGVGLLAGARGAGADGPPGSGAEQDPRVVFRTACDRLKALEPKYDLLAGVRQVKPEVEADAGSGLKTAYFVFERNANPPGKQPATAKEAGKPFVYVSVSTWAGFSMQPAGDMYHFQWKGQTYQAWVRVFASDPDLVNQVKKQVADAMREPPAAK